MAEEVNNNNQPPVTPTGTDPKPPVEGDQNPDNLSIPKHRFDEVNQQLKAEREARAALEKEKKDATEATLKEQNKWKELAESREKELNETKESVKQTRLNNAIERAAAKAGAVDPEAVLALIDKSKIQVAQDGTITGVEEAVKSLSEGKAYLFGKGNTQTLGNGTNPADTTTVVKRFRLSQLSDAKFYRENEADIRAAQAAGTIDLDS